MRSVALRPRLTVGLPLSQRHKMRLCNICIPLFWSAETFRVKNAWLPAREAELRRISLPRTRVNKGKREGPSVKLGSSESVVRSLYELRVVIDRFPALRGTVYTEVSIAVAVKDRTRGVHYFRSELVRQTAVVGVFKSERWRYTHR